MVTRMDYQELQEKLDLSSVRSICRLCLKTTGRLEDLFFNNSDDSLVDQIFECTSVKMVPANGISSAICSTCKLTLKHMFKFREQCIRCEEIFQSKLEKTENITIEVVPDIFGMHSDEETTDGIEDTSSSMYTSFKREGSWHEDIEDAVGSAVLMKGSTSPVASESPSESMTEEGSLNMSNEQGGKNYTLVPSTDIDLKSLVIYVKDKKHWRCPHCDKLFGQSGNLKAHINTHTGYRPYTCNLCNRSFAQKSNLNYHMKASHDPARPFKCNECDRAFATMDQMVVHLKTKHVQSNGTPKPLPEKKYNCPFCSKSFTQGYNMKLHINTHTGERPYKCDQCDKTFTQRSNLNVHYNKSHRNKQI